MILKRGQNVKYLHMSIFVVRAFLRLREWVAHRAELAARMAELERRVGQHDRELRAIIQTVRQLLQPPEEPRRRRIGFGARGSE